MDKIRTCYEWIEFNTPIFHKAYFKPTLINFIYGKNGTGKTTIAREIRSERAKTDWHPGIDPSSVNLCVYNEDYISENVRSYGNIPGVFTLTKKNAESKKAADEKTEVMNMEIEEEKKLRKQLDEAERTAGKANDKYFDQLWKYKEDLLAKTYPEIKFIRNKERFAGLLEATLKEMIEDPSIGEPRLEEIDSLYKTVYSREALQNSVKTTEYKMLPLDAIPTSPLTEKKIVGLSDTPFADFVKKIGALDWVTTGHNLFHDKAGSQCPYCQRELRPDFEEQLAACYDEEYKRDIQELNRFLENYISSSKLIIQSAEENLRISFESPLIKKYQTALTLLQERLKYNQEILEKKLAAPGVPVFLEKTDTLVDDLNAVAEDINKEITLHNSIIADIPGKQQECVTLFQQYIAFKNQSEIAVRNEQRKKEAEQKQALIDAADSHKDKAVKLQAEIAELNKDTINTTAAKDSINALLESVGFRGFRLREKPDSKYVYELVREAPDGSISVVSGERDISEGERHFIAFLYFYHTVIGSQSDDGRRTDKIVVIDDPVSSMDSDTLFVVAALTRELIGICYNNYALSDDENREDYIKQIFCLTHNPYFFREISYNHLSDHECVSVFEIKKREENKSTIDQCKIDGVDNSLGEANVSPVRNGYDALWQEYCSTESTDVLMISSGRY